MWEVFVNKSGLYSGVSSHCTIFKITHKDTVYGSLWRSNGRRQGFDALMEYFERTAQLKVNYLDRSDINEKSG